jgi:hypothetical protein
MTTTSGHDRLDEDETALIAAWRRAKADPQALAALREFADRQWRRIDATNASTTWLGRDALLALALALLAACAIKLPALFGLDLEADADIYARNLGLFVLPMLSGYFLMQRDWTTSTGLTLGLMFFAAGAVANLPPFARGGDFIALTTLHLPIALWLGVGIAHAGGRWREIGARMDFVRFSGELFILYVLLALGGMVFTALMMGLFAAIGVNMQPFFQYWLLPCGAVTAAVVAAWLVDASRGGIDHVAPLLARLFTPLFVVLLLVFLGAILWSGRGFEFQRGLIIALDLLLVVVTGLVLYTLSARDSLQPPGTFDALQLVLVVAALLVDALALWTMATRISEFGFTPNRVAALGENLVLLVNLAGTAILYLNFLRRRVPMAALEHWQMRYLPVHALWAAIVVVVFPLVFPAV